MTFATCPLKPYFILSKLSILSNENSDVFSITLLTWIYTMVTVKRIWPKIQHGRTCAMHHASSILNEGRGFLAKQQVIMQFKSIFVNHMHKQSVLRYGYRGLSLHQLFQSPGQIREREIFSGHSTNAREKLQDIIKESYVPSLVFCRHFALARTAGFAPLFIQHHIFIDEI